MATNAAHGISAEKFANIPLIHKELLGEIRHWANVSFAQTKDLIWLKGFYEDQLNSKEMICIPGVKRFYSQANKLFLLGSLLPQDLVPSVLWTPINRAIKIGLPSFNHNYFGNHPKLKIEIIPSSEEHESLAMICDLDEFEKYMSDSPEIRTENLHWVLLNKKSVFIFGTPLLPINAKTYWRDFDQFLPSGYSFNFQILAKAIDQKNLSGKENYTIWFENSRFIEISKNRLQKLSISSYRATWYEILNKQKVL